MNYILLTQQGGILKPFAWALGKVFEVIYSMLDKVGIESIGLCIIIFPIIVRLFLLPSAIKQQKFTKLNALISPEITKIQNKYKGKKDQQSQLSMNAEIQTVYDKYGVSPAGSCLQLLIQFPILFALYRVIYNVPAYVGQVKEYYLAIIQNLNVSQIKEYFGITVDSVDKLSTEQLNQVIDCLYGYTRAKIKLPEGVDLTQIVESIGNAKADLALKNINQINHFLMFDLQKSPRDMYAEGIKWAILIPILAGLTQFIFSKISMSLNKGSTPKEMEENPMMSSMKTMNYIMPLMSMFMTWGFASALGIYWVASSLIMLIQQIGLNIYFSKVSIDDIVAESKEKAEKKREKRGFTANMISNAAAMNTSLNENNNNNNTNSNVQLTRKQKEEQYEKAMEKYNSSISSDKNSISARANMVRDFENRKK